MPPLLRQENFQIGLEHVELWLKKNHIRQRHVERGLSVPIIQGGEPVEKVLTPDLIQRLISVEDPVVWAYLNLQSLADIPGYCQRGDPLTLLPIQAELARLEGNVMAECAAEVGKTQDIGVRLLHRMDTAAPGDTCLIVVNREVTATGIWDWVMDQLSAHPTIGGGYGRPDKRHFGVKFKAGTSFDTRLTGTDGESLRGAHKTGIVFADEVAMYRALKIWSELWRCGMPGCVFRIYTTPNGEYGSPYYALSTRALPINGPTAEEFDDPNAGAEEIRAVQFKKFWIAKQHLGPAFYNEERLAAWRQQWAEHTVGWLNNVEGVWGTPSASVFPMHLLEPVLEYLPDYRVVVAQIDRRSGKVKIDAAELSEEKKGEVDLLHVTEPFDLSDNAAMLAPRIAALFPPAVETWTDPQLYCGIDLGTEDPTGFLFVERVGDKWRDVFRLHLQSALYPEQAAIFAHLDHASGHRVKYSADPGNAGSSFIQFVTREIAYRRCPVCLTLTHFGERLRAYAFGDKTDDVDHRTGMPILNPNEIDAAGNMKPYRVMNKEYSTRVIERKIVQRSWAIARDNGAGNPALSSYRLLTNHTQRGETSTKGERRFRLKDDHDVDARRQVALRIVGETRRTAGFVAPSVRVIASSGPRGGYADQYGLAVTRAAVVEMSPAVTGRGSAFGSDW